MKTAFHLFYTLIRIPSWVACEIKWVRCAGAPLLEDFSVRRNVQTWHSCELSHRYHLWPSSVFVLELEECSDRGSSSVLSDKYCPCGHCLLFLGLVVTTSECWGWLLTVKEGSVSYQGASIQTMQSPKRSKGGGVATACLGTALKRGDIQAKQYRRLCSRAGYELYPHH